MHLRHGQHRFYRVLRVNFRAQMVELEPMFDAVNASCCERAPMQRLPCLRTAETSFSSTKCVADLVKRTGVALQADKGHWYGSVALDVVPPEIAALHRDQVLQRRAEKIAYAALHPDERQRLFEEALQELRKDPGFIEVTLKPPTRR